METEAGYLALQQFKELAFGEGISKVSRADEPTNIIWEGHDRGKEAKKSV